MLAGFRYVNVYEEPVIGGRRRTPSAARRSVDQQFGLKPPRDFFFGALSSGRTGVRFYGEYYADRILGPVNGRVAVKVINHSEMR